MLTLGAMSEPNEIRLDDGVAPYLVGKVLHLPPPVDGDRLRLIEIPHWGGRGGVLLAVQRRERVRCDATRRAGRGER